MGKINKAAVSYHDNLVESLQGDETAQIEFIKANFEDNGDMPSVILSAIRTVAEARGFKNFAESADLNRENLYRVLSEGGNPRLDTFFKILDALGLRLSVEAKAKVG
ncbi:MAG: putative addiction module antidote protein [Bdellovibrionaceae bacterium]|nr:putative addiction module antidote protein [Pseudobdellovibrionaceae bacterium]